MQKTKKLRLDSRSKLLIVSALLLVVSGCNQTPQNATTSADGVEPAPAEVTDPHEPAPAYVRAVHTVRGAGPLALAIDDKKLIGDLTFGAASDFVGLHGEKIEVKDDRDYRVTVLDAAGKAVGGPKKIDLDRGEDVTIVIGGTPGKITLETFDHDSHGATPEAAKLAVLHADPALPEIEIAIDNDRWKGDLEFGEVTDYRKVASGAHTMRVTYDKSRIGIVDDDDRADDSAPATVRSRTAVTLNQALNLEAGKVYSVIAFQDSNDLPKLRVLEDKFVPALARSPEAGSPTVAGNAATNNAATGSNANTTNP